MVVYFFGDDATFSFLQEFDGRRIRNMSHDYSEIGPGIQPWIVQAGFFPEYLEARWSEADPLAVYPPVTIWIPEDSDMSDYQVHKTVDVFMTRAKVTPVIVHQKYGGSVIIKHIILCHWFARIMTFLSHPEIEQYVKQSDCSFCNSDPELRIGVIRRFENNLDKVLIDHLNGCPHCRDGIAPSLRTLYKIR
jgi:hypothetical protein